MATGKISKRTIDAMRPGERDQFLWDDSTKGFGIKCTPAGRKIFLFQYRPRGGGAPKRVTIGEYGEWTEDKARKAAEKLRLSVVTGGDPVAERLEAERAKAARKAADDRAEQLATVLRIDRLSEAWLAARSALAPRTRTFYRSTMALHIIPKIGDVAFPALSVEDWHRIEDAIPADQPATRRNAFATLRAFCAWAAGRGHGANPLRDIEAPDPVKSRERVLSKAELVEIMAQADKLAPAFAALYRLAILTGQRRSEIAELDWQELDRKAAVWSIPGSRTKNGSPHIVPLSPAAVAEFDRLAGGDAWPRRGYAITTDQRTPVSGFSAAKRQIDALLSEAAAKAERDAPKPWRFHDLRRSLATGFQQLGIRFEVTEAVLNHLSGARGGVAGVYQRHDWKEEKRTALEKWADHLAAADAADAANVIELDSRRKA